MNKTEVEATFAAEEVVHVGQIPNPLSCAHFLATTPLFAERAAFVVMENAVDRHIVATALPFFSPKVEVMEWDGDVLNLPRLHNAGGAIVTDALTVEESHLPARSAYEKSLLRLQVQGELKQSDLKTFLAVNGYESDHTANAPGLWDSRGSIVDVHIGFPLRIEFDGNTVASLSRFDLADGKTKKKLREVALPPLHAKGRSSIVDHLPDNAVLVPVHVDEYDSDLPQLVIDPFLIDGAHNAGYVETKSYHLRVKELLKDVKGKTVHAFTSSPKKVQGLVESASTHRFDIPTGGFEHASSKTMVLTDRSIGIGEEKRKAQAKRVQEAMLRALTPGDFVVHQFHGVARFTGMNVMHVNELDREYFVLEYAGNDKIYVPVEMAYRIDTYVGDPNPKINKLSDASWNEVVRRVQEHSLEFARELLDQYAQRSAARAPQMLIHAEEKELDEKCEFRLTVDQVQSLADVFDDLAQEKPMDRLLCGDVGFGKTEVAIRAAYRAVLNGYQVAAMAPTTVLAQQHLDTFQARLDGFGVNVAGLSRLRSASEQKQTIAGIKQGTIDIVVGTHRLTSKDVEFKRLGFLVIDEEQRFGVKAKEKLTKLRSNVHMLTMTATPIPRTLHLSIAGIRDISTILTPPTLRKAIQTKIQPLQNTVITEAITREMERNGQTYFVYNRVESIGIRKKQLEALVPKARIGIAHGQMSPAELAGVMHDFDVGDIDVLLATTIVENGLDIPNANTLLVENASMFGLAELYQLKGRVGRSERQGYAYFLYKEKKLGGDIRKRFIALQEADELGSGFELAMKDMEIRGIGNILGKQQHGHAVKIGMHLYVRLLNHAIQEMQGVEQETFRDVAVDIPLEARIPEELLEREEDRMLLYQQLASITSEGDLQKKREQYSVKPRFSEKGELHPTLKGLFDLLEIKLLASKSTLLSIDTTYPNEVNHLESPRITLNADAPLMGLGDKWELVWTKDTRGTRARSSLGALGPQWVHHLKQVIRQCSKTSQEVE